MLGNIVSLLASPRKILDGKKIWGEHFLNTQDGMKHAEMKVGKFFGGEKKLDEKKNWLSSSKARLKTIK